MNSLGRSLLSRRSSSLAPVPPSRSSATSIATADFNSYKTYAWAPLSKSQAAIDRHRQGDRDAVEKNLSADDLTKVREKPDIYVILPRPTGRERVRAITPIGDSEGPIGREVLLHSWPGHPVTYAVLDQHKVVRSFSTSWGPSGATRLARVSPSVFGLGGKVRRKAGRAVHSCCSGFRRPQCLRGADRSCVKSRWRVREAA